MGDPVGPQVYRPHKEFGSDEIIYLDAPSQNVAAGLFRLNGYVELALERLQRFTLDQGDLPAGLRLFRVSPSAQKVPVAFYSLSGITYSIRG